MGKELPVEIPPGDMGIGLCYACIKLLVIQIRDGKPPGKRSTPRWAVTWAPGPFTPPGQPRGVFQLVAVPSCLECLGFDEQQPTPPPPQQHGRPYMVAEPAPVPPLLRPGQ